MDVVTARLQLFDPLPFSKKSCLEKLDRSLLLLGSGAANDKAEAGSCCSAAGL